MKHLLRDETQEKELDNFFTVYSCELEDGRRTNSGIRMIRLGEDGKIMLLMCESCHEQLVGQILAPLVIDAMKDSGELKKAVMDLLVDRLQKRNGNEQ